MGVEDVVNTLRKEPRYSDRVEHVEVLPSTNAVFGRYEDDFPPCIRRYLAEKNMTLYTHQCDAIRALKGGKSIVITTRTASGKTLAFNIAIFEKLHADKAATALYLYPTKALSNDQLEVIEDMQRITGLETNASLYDGDTPTSMRPRIRQTSRIILSNPYELHQILPWHHQWEAFLANLRFIVIDEAHRYRGVFGSNVAFVIRRLRRILDSFGARPQFILSTATLANPTEFGQNLVGEDVELIARDGSPRGTMYFVLYNPYFGGAGELSVHQETRDLFVFFVRNNLQTLCFTVSRKMAELVALWARKELQETEPYLAEKLTSYRAGYLPKERREIEDKLRTGELVGVTSTNALELGIDVGSLDSVIISGFPGTVISTWQQAGRAGRRAGESIAVLVAFQNPLDQYFMKHPKAFFGKPHEHAIVDFSNHYIVARHLMCAASEAPLKAGEAAKYFGDESKGLLEQLEEAGLVEGTPMGWVYCGTARATEIAPLDNIRADIVKVVCNGELLETIDRVRAYREAHKDAVLLHQGQTYTVESLDLKAGIARVQEKEVDYYTQAIEVGELRILDEFDRNEFRGFCLSLGDVDVREQYVGYKIMKFEEVLATKTLDLPPLDFETTAMWFTIPDSVGRKNKDKGLDFFGGMHAIEHAMIGMMPFHVMCDRRDLGGITSPSHKDTTKPTIFIYDGVEGGIGLTERAFELFPKIVEMTLELVKDCRCEEGCPGCIYSPKCGNENRPMDKRAAILILQDLLSRMAPTRSDTPT